VYSSPEINLPLELNASQLDLMENVLKIFYDATFAISTATVTVSEVIPIVNSINKVFQT